MTTYSCPICRRNCHAGPFENGEHSIKCPAGHYESDGNLWGTTITVAGRSFFFDDDYSHDDRQEQNKETEKRLRVAIEDEIRKKGWRINWQKVGF